MTLTLTGQPFAGSVEWSATAGPSKQMPKDVDSILDDIEQESIGLHEWLKRRPEAEARFWEFIERGYYERALPFTLVVEKWREEFPEAPEQVPSNTKVWVKRERARRH